MHIDPKSKIAGIPALKIRDFLRKAESYTWQAEFLQKRLRVSLHKANQIISKLAELGYIEPDDRSNEKNHCVFIRELLLLLGDLKTRNDTIHLFVHRGILNLCPFLSIKSGVLKTYYR
jgi:hypothetical protein